MVHQNTWIYTRKKAKANARIFSQNNRKRRDGVRQDCYLNHPEGPELLAKLLSVGFSAVPVTLYVPQVRTLTLFVEAMEELVRETEVFVHEGRRRLWVAASGC
ncbi:hypothetical protein Droror1_Dr00011372 [Drosera rotundifolia]